MYMYMMYMHNYITVNPFKYAGFNVHALGPATYSRELKFVVQL